MNIFIIDIKNKIYKKNYINNLYIIKLNIQNNNLNKNITTIKKQ